MSDQAIAAPETSGDGVDLLERERERQVLVDAVERARAGQGCVVVIEGPAGIGKTRLIQEALRIAAESDLSLLSGRGSELEREFAFGVTRQLFEHRVTELKGEPLTGAAALAAPLFPDVAPELATEVEDSQALLHGLYWLCVNLTRAGPLLLAVDDAHWCDTPSLRWLAYLANRLHELPALLVVAKRRDEPDAPRQLLANLTSPQASDVIHPAALSRRAIGEITARRLGQEPDPKFVIACHELTQGNPFFVHAAIGALAREHVAPDAEGAEQLEHAAAASAADVIVQRLGRLSDAALLTARALAVLQKAPDRLTIAEVSGLDNETAATAIDELVKFGLVAEDGTAFLHPLVRSVTYAEVSALERDRLHTKAAKLLDERGAHREQIAAHVLASDPAREAWRVDVLVEAARLAASRGAPDVAATYLRRALAEPPDQPRRAELLYRLGLAEVAARGIASTDYIEEAIELEADPRRKAEMALRLGTILFTQAQFGRAAETLESGLSVLPGAGADLATKMEATLFSIALLDLPTLEGMGGLAGILERMAGKETSPGFLATSAWIHVATAAPASRGAKLAEQSLESGGLAVENDPIVFAGSLTALMAAGRFETAKAVWDDAAEVARRRSSISTLNFALVLRAAVLVRLGRVAEAEADMREIVERALELQPSPEEWRVSIPWVLAPLIDALLERGHAEEAAQWLAMSGIGGELPPLLQFTYLLDSMGRLAIVQGRAQEAVAHFRECGARLDRWGIANPGFVPWRSHLAPVLNSSGERQEAIELCDEEIAAAERFEVPRELGMALRAKGLVMGGDAGIDLFQQAAQELERAGALLEQARALTDLGTALRAAGKRVQSREPLRQGLDLATRCGATALITRAREELVAAGARPRRTLLSGLEALTASELRVCRMAAEGLSNRQIAEALFVTEKTVEGHLGNAYRKLDVSSRSELPDVLAVEDSGAKEQGSL